MPLQRICSWITRFVCTAVPQQIWSYDAIAPRSKVVELVAPVEGAGGEAVQEEDGWPVASWGGLEVYVAVGAVWGVQGRGADVIDVCGV